MSFTVTIYIVTPNKLGPYRRRSTVNFGGGKAFLTEIMHEKLTKCSNFTWYLPEKLTKFPHFTRHLPEICPHFLHYVCPKKNIFSGKPNVKFRHISGKCRVPLPPDRRSGEQCKLSKLPQWKNLDIWAFWDLKNHVRMVSHICSFLIQCPCQNILLIFFGQISRKIRAFC